MRRRPAPAPRPRRPPPPRRRGAGGGGGGRLVGVALAPGLVLAVLVSALGAVSGGHFTPAVTAAVLVAGRIPAARAGWYIVAQAAGALAAGPPLRAAFSEAVWGPPPPRPPALGADISPVMGIVIELVTTLLLVFAVLGTAVDPRGPKIGGLAIGLAIAADILFPRPPPRPPPAAGAAAPRRGRPDDPLPGPHGGRAGDPDPRGPGDRAPVPPGRRGRDRGLGAGGRVGTRRRARPGRRARRSRALAARAPAAARSRAAPAWPAHGAFERRLRGARAGHPRAEDHGAGGGPRAASAPAAA